MSIMDKIFHRFSEKQEKKILLNEQTARLTVFKQEKKPEDTTIIQEDKTKDTIYPLVEREIRPAKIICTDCGGETLEGLEYCDKCGGEINNS